MMPFARSVPIPRSIIRGRASVACRSCGADAPACALTIYTGDWRCDACARYGRITRDRQEDSRGRINLELAPDARPSRR